MKKTDNRPAAPAYRRFWVGIPVGFLFMFLFLIAFALFLHFRDTYAGRNEGNETKLLFIANDAFCNKQYKKSKSFYEKVLKINPNNHDANYFLGSLYSGYLTPRDLKKGLFYTQKALRLKKDDKDLTYEARELWENAQFYESEMILRECLGSRSYKEKAFLYEKLGYVLKMQLKFKESLKAYQRAQSLNPTNYNIQCEIDALPSSLN